MSEKYIDIIEHSTGNVVEQIDVSGRSDRQVERVDNGININMNHEMYYTLISDTKKEVKRFK